MVTEEWVGGAVTSWFRWAGLRNEPSPDRGIACSWEPWARHFTRTVSLSTQVYKFTAGIDSAMD